MIEDLEIPERLRPVLVVDKREKTPLVFTRMQTVQAYLASGDYSIAGAETCFTVERKSTKDLLDCSTGRERERFERVLQRMRGFQFRRLLIVGCEASVTARKGAWHWLLETEARFDVPVMWARTPDEAARIVERWAYWWARSYLSTARALVQATRRVPEMNGDGITILNKQG